MTVRSLRTIAIVLTVAITAACNKQPSADEQRVAELEKQLADTQKQLTDANQPANAVPASAPDSTAGAPPAASNQAAKDAAKEAQTKQVVQQQQAVNAQQAETNAKLQQDIDKLKPKEHTLPAGTVVQARTVAELSTSKLKDGSTFDALLERDLKSGDVTLAKAGSRVVGYVITSDPGGRV